MKTFFNVAILLFIGAILAFFLYPAISTTRHPEGRSDAKNAVIQLIMATKAYLAEYGEPPKGDRKTILRVLEGNNPRKIVFIELNQKRITKEGIFVDSWGTPYVFDLSRASDPWAYSFGKDKLDDGGCNDDVTSWK